MTPQEWLAEVDRRLHLSEGCRLTMYRDTAGIPTIAYEFNLQCGDACQALSACGVADAAARASLPSGVFDRLSDARRFVIVDLTYNMGPGEDGWGGFHQTQATIAQAVQSTDAATAHALYGQAADHLAASAWATQVGDRARRDVAMMRSSAWVDPCGDGTH